ncbi:MAG: hypothetical protein D6744_17535 [Planctomycetota bacterium]|nr:MAG: hypothetical protein D6744_17535 [Planctomycetota bacterium]
MRSSGALDPVEQGMLVNRVSDLLSLPASEVYDWMIRAKRTARSEASALPSDTSELSAYDASVRGLPGGLVSAVEELFGLALTDAQIYESVGGTLAACSGYCDTWRRLDDVIRALREGNGEYQMRDVLARCEDAALCDLFDRAVRAVRDVVDGESVAKAARARVQEELELLRRAQLRERLRSAATKTDDADEAFAAVLAAARRHSGPLGAQERWRRLGRTRNEA